jgi:hypothetical protein
MQPNRNTSVYTLRYSRLSLEFVRVFSAWCICGHTENIARISRSNIFLTAPPEPLSWAGIRAYDAGETRAARRISRQYVIVANGMEVPAHDDD